MADGLLGPGGALDPGTPVAGLGLLGDVEAPGPFKRGFGAGMAGVKSNLWGAAALAAHGAGAIAPAVAAPVISEAEQAALANAQAQSEAAATQSQGIEQVDWKSPSSVVDHFKWLLGNAVPSLATMFAGGVAGRGFGALAGKGMSAAGKAAAMETGMLAGAVAPDIALEAGGIYPEALKTGVENPATRAAVGGALAASADFIPLLAAEHYLKPLGKGGFGALAKGAVKGAPVGAALEGSQELIQSVIERAAAGQSLTSPDAVSDYINSFAGGAAPGLLFGAGIGARHGAAPVQGQPSSTNHEQGAAAEVTPVSAPAETSAPAESPNVGTISPNLGTLEDQHAAASQQLVGLTIQTRDAQAAHDALLAKRDALAEEAKLPIGQRRAKEAILAERKTVNKQVEAAKKQVEALGGQLHETRTAVAGLAAQLDPVAAAMQAAGAQIKPEVTKEGAPVLPTVEEQTARAVEGARVAAGEQQTLATENNKVVSGKEGDIRDMIASTLAVKKGISDAKKLEHANHIDSAIAAITHEAASVPESYREQFVKTEVNKRIGMRLDAAVKGDIADHILGATTGQAKVQYSKGAVARATREGSNVAIRLTRTERDHFGVVFTNEADRQELLSEVPSAKFDGERLIVAESDMSALADYADSAVTAARGEGYKAPASFARMEFPPRPDTAQSHAALTQDEFDTLPEPAKFAAVDEFNRVMRQKGTELRSRIANILGDRKGVVIKTFMATPGSPIGSYTRINQEKAVITMALNAKDGLSVADHEGYHAAEDLVLTRAEVQIIENALKEGRPLRLQLETKVQQYDRENGTSLTDEVTGVPAEARAYAYEFWKRGELKAEGALLRIFRTLQQFFERVANAVRGLGFRSMEDIFTALSLGQFAERITVSGQISETAGKFGPDGIAWVEKPDVRELYSKAAALAESQMATREENGELEQMQQNREVARFLEDANSEPWQQTLKRVGLKPELMGAKGGLSRWWQDYMATPNFISASSQGFKNVYRTLNTFLRYRDTLVEKMLKERIPEWYHASFTDQDAAFGALLTRTTEKLKADSLEYRDLYAQLTDTQKRLFDSANNMIGGFLDAELAVDREDYKRYLTSPGAYDKWLTARVAQVQEMKDTGYVPLRRYGDHTVRIFKTVTDAEGASHQVTVALEMFRHPDQAVLAADIYKAEAARQGLDYTVEIGIKQKNVRETAPSVQQFLDTLRRQGVEVSQTERERLVMTLTNSESMVRNRLMHREGIPGYSKDGERVLNEFGVNMAAKIAYSRFGSAIDAAAEGRAVTSDVDANGNPTIEIDYRKTGEDGKEESIEDYKARNLWTQDGPMSGYYYNRAAKLSDFVLVPDHSGAWSRNARAAAMVYFIGGSISGAVVNTMSIPMLLVPQLSVHTNYANGLTTAMGAWRLTWQHQAILRDITRLKNLEHDPNNALPGIDNVPGLRDALVAAADKLQDTELHQIMGISQGQLFAQSRTIRRAMNTWMAPFRISEQTNRITSFIAGYKIGQGNGLKGQELFNFARDMVDSTQNNYSLANRPGIATTPIGAMLFMFKSFPLFMIEAATLMYKASPRSAVFMLLGLTAMTGVQGLPFAEAIENLIDTIAQHLFNSPFNTRRAMRNIIKDASEAIVGYDASDLVLRGMINEIVGVSMSSRIGAGDFVPGSRLGTADADQGKILSQLLGAPYSMIHDAVTNVGKLTGGVLTGDWKQAADALRAGGPVALRNVIKGVEQLDTGYASDSKGKKIQDVSTLSAILQLGGLSSAGVARAYELESINIQTKAFYTQVSQDMQNHLIQALRANDQEKVKEISDLREAWNRDNPTMPIMPNAAAVRRGIVLSGMNLDERSRILWGRRLGGANIFNE